MCSRQLIFQLHAHCLREGWEQAVTSDCYYSQILQGSQLLFSVQSLSHVQLFVTPWTAAHQVFLTTINSWSLLKLMSVELVMPSNHLILCRPLLLLPSIFPGIRVFSSKLVLCIRWLKYWSFSFSISPSNEYSGLISFRMDWFDLLAVQGTLKSLLQHHSSKASVLQCSPFFIVQLSHPYMTIGKTIALARWTFARFCLSTYKLVFTSGKIILFHEMVVLASSTYEFYCFS